MYLVKRQHENYFSQECKSMSAEDDRIMNVFWNALAPVDFSKSAQVQGTLSHVAAEVLLSKLLRRVLKMEQRGFMELGVIHLLSQPFLGGLFFGANLHDVSNSSVMEAAQDGAKQTPAVLVAGYIVATSQKGFALPSFSIRDILITLASKIGTRVILTQAINSIPTFIQNGLGQHDALVVAQKRAGHLSDI